jgi:hypothetical protein
MAMQKTPERVNDGARPESDLVEIARQNGDFRKNYGPWLGAFLYWLSIKATRPRSFWWNGLLVTLATGAIALLQKFNWPFLHG